VVAASIANWVIAKRQSTGMIVTGLDPLSSDTQAVPLQPRKGRAHLMRLLEILARIRAMETDPFPPRFRQHRVDLPWGTTAIIITGSAERPLLDEMIEARRQGINPVLILCGEHPNHRATAQMIKPFGFPVYIFRSEKDLDIWRG
jgi:uncharacterized protein (DUF58 family)